MNEQLSKNCIKFKTEANKILYFIKKAIPIKLLILLKWL